MMTTAPIAPPIISGVWLDSFAAFFPFFFRQILMTFQRDADDEAGVLRVPPRRSRHIRRTLLPPVVVAARGLPRHIPGT
jgi:hypothetical protein